MPQMKPIFWLYLYISFFLIIISYMVMNFYNLLFLNSLNNKIIYSKMKNFNWKW